MRNIGPIRRIRARDGEQEVGQTRAAGHLDGGERLLELHPDRTTERLIERRVGLQPMDQPAKRAEHAPQPRSPEGVRGGRATARNGDAAPATGKQCGPRAMAGPLSSRWHARPSPRTLRSRGLRDERSVGPPARPVRFSRADTVVLFDASARDDRPCPRLKGPSVRRGRQADLEAMLAKGTMGEVNCDAKAIHQ